MEPGQRRPPIAYVVGGSLGIGRAVAEALAARGDDVLIFARRREPLDEALQRIAARRRLAFQRVEARTLDVCDAQRVERVLAEAVAGFGPPDLLVNCAGRARPRRFEEVSEAQLRETLELNLIGSWRTIRALLPSLRKRRATVVNVASLAGLIGVFGYTDYAASKFALIGFSEALRNELAPHDVRVHVLCPPDTATPGLVEEDRTKPPETRAVSAAARVLAAEEVADALLAGLARGRFLIVPGRAARFAARAKRWWPGVMERALDRAVRRAHDGPLPAGGDDASAQSSQDSPKRST